MTPQFERDQMVWLGNLAPQWANELEHHREMWTRKPFLPFNGYGKVLSQFKDVVELNVMVGQLGGCIDGRVFRLTAKELAENQNANVDEWKQKHGWE